MKLNNIVREGHSIMGIVPILLVFLFLTGCTLIPIGNRPPISHEKTIKKLTELGYTPKYLRYIMDYPYKERPWICICENNKREEWGVALHPSGKVQEVQLGTKEHL